MTNKTDSSFAMKLKGRRLFLRTIALVLITLTGVASMTCTHEEELTFPVQKSYADPQERLNEFQEKIASSENGWVGFLTPLRGRIYTFFIQFSDNENVVMYSDASTSTLSSPVSAKYRIDLASTNARVLFDTGSVLDKIKNTPNSAVDTEFTVRWMKEDTISLLGTQFGDEFTLIRATSEEAQSYKGDQLKSTISEVSAYLKNVNFLYAEPAPGILVQLQMSAEGRALLFTCVNNGAKISGSDFSFTPAGVVLRNPLTSGDLSIAEMSWKREGGFSFTYKGSSIVFKMSQMPVAPLHYIWGTEFPYSISVLSPAYSNLPGWSSEFSALWRADDKRLKADLDARLYSITFDIDVLTGTMKLYVEYGQFFASTIQFPYLFTKSANGIYSFVEVPIDSSTDEGKKALEFKEKLSNLFKAIKENRYTIDFFDGGREWGLIGQFRSVEDNTIYFTGYFYN